MNQLNHTPPLNFSEINDTDLIEGFEYYKEALISRGDLNRGSVHNDYFSLLLKRFKDRVEHDKITDSMRHRKDLSERIRSGEIVGIRLPKENK